ncbi:hypothetical protein BDZ89DRAFT_1073427 [Hymenopellis radicata]|nr:hypothetical protein BDZ89DRAFT_1073427 [Hymenopellis radicata]
MVSIVNRGVDSVIAPRSTHLNLSGQDVLFIIVLILGVLLVCMSIALLIAYIMRRLRPIEPLEPLNIYIVSHEDLERIVPSKV